MEDLSSTAQMPICLSHFYVMASCRIRLKFGTCEVILLPLRPACWVRHSFTAFGGSCTPDCTQWGWWILPQDRYHMLVTRLWPCRTIILGLRLHPISNLLSPRNLVGPPPWHSVLSDLAWGRLHPPSDLPGSARAIAACATACQQFMLNRHVLGPAAPL